jgi:hypothetical protein
MVSGFIGRVLSCAVSERNLRSDAETLVVDVPATASLPVLVDNTALE